MLTGKMNAIPRHLWIISAIWIVSLWFVLPASFEWYGGRSSMVRFDPKISTDYNCIFVEAHSAKKFTVLWLARDRPGQYLRLRYTPRDDEPYGIMFIDPQTMAFETHAGWASKPSHLAGKLDSPEVILNWMQSQPRSESQASHTNDARELFEAIRILAPQNLEKFALSTNCVLKNFTIGHQFPAKSDLPSWTGVVPLLLFWIAEVGKIRRQQKLTRSPRSTSKPPMPPSAQIIG
jgi:hypothetical protein